MSTQTQTATFLIFEADPVVRMDIQEMLLRSYKGWTVVIVGALEDLSQALEATRGPRIIIVSTDPDSFRPLVPMVKQAEIAGAVLITERPTENATFPELPLRVVSKPFKSAQLLDAVRSALEHLRSSPS
ncbi:hypothetical protein KDD17_13625 [Sulfitobacter albidus]|uniref:Response regulatory domain-containing protein n=1 Tax=Sulfitobacter albidus TaxID=2829501 RepID=A0A975JCL0_9RHOB|nr:hypothetical protein [Sulfitobacter albidus]QUJ75958.1 hypothetical protein KDD17_13625 [Sulfitobacter albidus]